MEGKKVLKRFFSYYRPHRKLFFIDFFCAVFVGLLELGFPIAVSWFIDDLLPEGNWGTIVAVSTGLLLLYILSSSMQFVVNYWGHKLGINIETDLRRDLFLHVQRQSFGFFDNTKTGNIMSRITNDLMDIGELAHHGPEDFFIAIMTFIGAFWIMLTINVKLALVAIIIVPFLIWLIYYSNIKMNAAWTKMFGSIADVNARVEDSVSGARVVQSFTNETYEMERFNKNNQFFRKAKLAAYKVMSMNLTGIYLTTRLMTITILVYGAWLSFSGALSYGELVAFILYLNILFKPIEKISALLELYPKGMAGFKRFTQLMDTMPDIQNRPGAVSVPHLSGDIRFQHVTFGYEENREILKDLSLSVKSGETIAFVGPSGAGKSTICSLIPRFYDVKDGAVTIDGIDVRDMTKESLRSQIGIVQQDVFLFTGTIKENIAYGRLDASQEEIEDAVEKAHLKEMIENLADGYDTQIGERGLKLSGGQKQRLAIARMFLKNPSILILDEATSALDTETETQIQKALTELSKDRTTLIIAHRLGTIKKADRILVITEDGIAEDGSHEELLSKDAGLFAKLHALQH
ncbi:ATP-binding cassette domain-containing protein [Halobacillus litoralis]|uniref:ATP-binding cassette domain-containing protein n=1 Tax=Halobacillus litoralis TaxID=45668 RepID=A0A845E3E2_9BACI|nr:ABC transporter ATP-binding protein [Halobacillus litoralis]MYL20194.1 ATP-binding cassette domain-containing protein [Halobacillus litoralis]